MYSLVLVLVDSLKPINDVWKFRERCPLAASRRGKRTIFNDVLGLEDRAEEINALVESVHR
jgi:hypothetical protein